LAIPDCSPTSLTPTTKGALFFTEDRTVTFLFEEFDLAELDFEEGLEGFGERVAT